MSARCGKCGLRTSALYGPRDWCGPCDARHLGLHSAEPVSLKHLAIAYGCAAAGSVEERELRARLLEAAGAELQTSALAAEAPVAAGGAR